MLVVDDDSVNRLLGMVILEGFGCDVDMAKNGKEALEKTNKKEYDLLLLDIHMPDIGGLEVAHQIRNIRKNHKMKIIAVTAAVLKEDIHQYYHAGINDYLIKPYKEIHLFNKICKTFHIKKHPLVLSSTELILKKEQRETLYNLYELKRVTRYDKDLIIKMLKIFIRNSQVSVQSFNRYLKENDWNNLGETAHRLIPSYRHLEADAVVSDLIEIKSKTLVTPQYHEIPRIVRHVIPLMKKTVNLLKQEIKKYR